MTTQTLVRFYDKDDRQYEFQSRKYANGARSYALIQIDETPITLMEYYTHKPADDTDEINAQRIRQILKD